MSIHVYGLTVSMLADASRAARTVDHAVTLFGAGVWHRQVELLAQARSMLDWRRAVARRRSSDAAAAIP